MRTAVLAALLFSIAGPAAGEARSELDYVAMDAFAVGTDRNIDSVEELEVDSFNVALAEARGRGEEWTRSPERIALAFAGATLFGPRRKVIVKIEPNEWEPGRPMRWARVTIEDEGYLDDSEFGQRYVIWLVPGADGSLKVRRAVWARLCRRRHWQFYTAGLCP